MQTHTHTPINKNNCYQNTHSGSSRQQRETRNSEERDETGERESREQRIEKAEVRDEGNRREIWKRE